MRLGIGRHSGIAECTAVPDFHARVRANRFIGTGPHARRFKGLSSSADVQYALRSASCVLTATEPQRDLATEPQSAQRAL